MALVTRWAQGRVSSSSLGAGLGATHVVSGGTAAGVDVSRDSQRAGQAASTQDRTVRGHSRQHTDLGLGMSLARNDLWHRLDCASLATIQPSPEFAVPPSWVSAPL